MEVQFQYIINLAKLYKRYNENQFILFETLRQLPREVLEEVYEEYGDTSSRFQPVNLLRAEIARGLLNGENVTPDYIEEIKLYIREQDLSKFQYLPRKFKREIENYQQGKRDMFANWQNYWFVLFPFFYRGEVKERVRLYLDQLSNQFLRDLKLTDYIYTNFDFYGPNKYGSDRCWIAIYPIHKSSHREAYQFFVNLTASPDVGCVAGSDVENREPDVHQPVFSYEEALISLESLKADILERNSSLKNYFKLTPGIQALEWDRFRQENIMAIGYGEIPVGDLQQYQSLEEMNSAAGLVSDKKNSQSKALWLFKTANIGDIVFATKGLNTCLGVGVIAGPYYYDEKDGECPHRRQMNWLTDKPYEYRAYTRKGYKNIFRPDTFTNTRVGPFLINEYISSYPELTEIFKKNEVPYADSELGPTFPVNYLERENSSELLVVAEESQFHPSVVSATSLEEQRKSSNFWWLTVNAKLWNLNNLEEGETYLYTTYNERGNRRRVYNYFEEVQPGDVVVAYENRPIRQIKAIFEVTKGIHMTQKEGEVVELQLMEKLEYPLNRGELTGIKGLENCEPLQNTYGGLFSLTEDEFDIIREVIDEKNIIQDKSERISTKRSYRFADDPDRPFMTEDTFFQIVSLLEKKKNIILQGPPGVGKTFIARKIAYEMMSEADDLFIEMVQFHQSYSYEDFVQGLRPNSTGSFELKNGIFYTFCQRALAHPDRNYFFIIDEINRGNLSKIFGELLMLIEQDKRGQNLKLTYAEEQDERFSVPPNLYIIGTMNTADRSLAIVDYALRRRFAFITLQPDYGDRFRQFLLQKGISSVLINHIVEEVGLLNEEIKNDLNLGEGFQIGHSYFCSYHSKEDEREWWRNICEFEIKPLLEEIWFDDSGKVKQVMKRLEF